MEHTNRLIHEKSPYLLQHAHNPVDWYPWGPEAFERAKSEDRPVFLSVGYSTCYWCHVMERESFENEEIAAILNGNFVAIKVDREERPDIDQVYMSAVQALTGRGGWPMSVFLTPEGKPFFGGTYYPPDTFRAVLQRVAETYRDDRPKIDAAAEEVVIAIERMSRVPDVAERAKLERSLVRDALTALHRSLDAEHGGFGAAPKFPPHNALSLLFHEYQKSGEAGLLQMATHTLEKMALGGLHDHVGGGFHRYATDAEWLVPHFEKMLYDNALLLRSNAQAHHLSNRRQFREVAEGIAGWVAREMTSPEGGFYSALDAESEGVEGRFYLWTKGEVIAVLGAAEGEPFCRAYNVEQDGNYREEATGRATGENILHLEQRIPELSEALGRPAADLEARMAAAREKLLDVRDRRVRPHRDDKILASWNGLMIGALAYAGRVLDRPQYTAAAEKAATFVLASMLEDGRVLRRWREGEARFSGYLEDYVYLADGMLELHEATSDRQWLDRAQRLMDTAVAEFWDEREGGFFFTAEHGEQLLVRPKDALDRPLPSGNGMAAQVLLRLSQLTGERRHFDLAEKTLQAFTPWMARAPLGTEALLLAASEYLEQQGTARPTPMGAPVTAGKHPVRVTAQAPEVQIARGERLDIRLRLEIAEGWHINSHAPLQDFLIPTTVAVAGGIPVSVGEISYPAGGTIDLAGETLSVYSGVVDLTVPLTVAHNATEGKGNIPLSLRFQACDEKVCLAPDALDLNVPIEIVVAR
jgi:uncharacterized protein YyaL (SSP411 family)